MGCWTANCGVTGLPIEDQDEAVGFLVIELGLDEEYYTDRKDTLNRNKFSGVCSPDDAFAPLIVPVRGKYDSYGCIENLQDTIGSSVVTDYFNVKPDFQSEHDPGKQGLDGFIKDVERGSIRTKLRIYDQEFGVGLFLVHGGFYEEIKHHEFYKELRESADEFFAGLDNADWDLDPGERFTQAVPLMGGYILPHHDGFQDNVFFKWAMDPRHRKTLSGDRIAVQRRIEALYDEGFTSSDEAVQSIADELSQAVAFHSLMEDNGRNYVPASGKGSQYNNMEEARFFAKATLNIANKQLREEEGENE